MPRAHQAPDRLVGAVRLHLAVRLPRAAVATSQAGLVERHGVDAYAFVCLSQAPIYDLFDLKQSSFPAPLLDLTDVLSDLLRHDLGMFYVQ